MKFTIYRDSSDGFSWRLTASNGQILAQGESYTRVANVLNVIKSLQKTTAKTPIVREDLTTKKAPPKATPPVVPTPAPANSEKRFNDGH